MTLYDRRGQLSQGQKKAMRRFDNDALKLPPNPEEWKAKEVGIGHGALSVFHQSGIVETVGRYNTENGDARHLWRTKPGMVEWVDDNIAVLPRTPCGCSTGFRTISAGETYSCTNDDCDIRFDRETAEELVT